MYKNALCRVNWKLALWVRNSCTCFYIHCIVTFMSALWMCTQELCQLCTCVSATWGYQLISIEVLCHQSLTSVHSWRTNCQKSSEPTKPFCANKCQALSNWRLKVSSDRSSCVSLAFAWEAELPNAATLITNWSVVNGNVKSGSAAVLFMNTSSDSSWTNYCSYYYHYRNRH